MGAQWYLDTFHDSNTNSKRFFEVAEPTWERYTQTSLCLPTEAVLVYSLLAFLLTPMCSQASGITFIVGAGPIDPRPEESLFRLKQIKQHVIHLFPSLYKAGLKFYSQNYNIIKGNSQLWDCADLDTIFLTLKRVHLNPKSKIHIKYISKSALIFPVFYSIFHPSSSLKTCFWVSFCSSYDIILSYLVKNNMDLVS